MSRQRKVSVGNEVKAGALLIGASLLCGMSTAHLLGYPISDGAAIAATASTAIFVKWQLTGRGWRYNSVRNIKTHKRQFASTALWGIKEGIDSDGIMRWYDRRDKPPEQFVFFGLDLPTKVPESMMYRFCERALYRTNISLDPERTTYKRNGRKLRSHEVLSKRYFTKKITPRFLPEQYDAIKEILELTGFWIDGRGGHPGILFVDHGITPQKMVHRVRWGWIDIIVRAQGQQKKPFWMPTASPQRNRYTQ